MAMLKRTHLQGDMSTDGVRLLRPHPFVLICSGSLMRKIISRSFYLLFCVRPFERIRDRPPSRLSPFMSRNSNETLNKILMINSDYSYFGGRFLSLSFLLFQEPPIKRARLSLEASSVSPYFNRPEFSDCVLLLEEDPSLSGHSNLDDVRFSPSPPVLLVFIAIDCRATRH